MKTYHFARVTTAKGNDVVLPLKDAKTLAKSGIIKLDHKIQYTNPDDPQVEHLYSLVGKHTLKEVLLKSRNAY